MKEIEYLFPKGVTKAVTFSYDDGVLQDRRLVSLFNDYELKATFNLNSKLHEPPFSFELNNHTITRLPIDELKSLYKDHEIAAHSATHPPLHTLSVDEVTQELFEDKKALEEMFHTEVLGMAFPFGNYSDVVLQQMDNVNLLYGRTVEDTLAFNLPNSFKTWHPTCHHNQDLMALGETFLNERKLSLFYIWGHSYDFDLDQNWNKFEDFCAFISHRKEIWYATNIEIYGYIVALRNLRIEENKIINDTNTTVWVKVVDSIYKIDAKTHIEIN